MASDEIINVDDVNYAVYKIGDWKNNYQINQIGLSREIPVTKNTLHHIIVEVTSGRGAIPHRRYSPRAFFG